MKLYRGGHVLYFTGGFPPVRSGSCVVNQNLLKGFDANSVTVVTYDHSVSGLKVEEGINVFRPVKLFTRLNSILLPIQKALALKRIGMLVKKKKPKLIIAAYPDLYFLSLGEYISSNYEIPLVLYLHDTIFEAHIGSKLEQYALSIQTKLFNKARLVCVMSAGMQELYADKYKLKTYPLLHTFEYPRYTVQSEHYRINDLVFWGGAVYSINNAAISKISKLLPLTNFTLEMTTSTSRLKLEKFGVSFDKARINYYETTADYWNAITSSKCLLLALDKQSDTRMDVDEISTIFPTKAIEYMFSKVPILVVCPGHYYLNKFFREHNCGVVVDDIDNNQGILNAFESIFNFEEPIRQKISNAREIAERLFNPDNVRREFKELLEDELLEEQ